MSLESEKSHAGNFRGKQKDPQGTNRDGTLVPNPTEGNPAPTSASGSEFSNEITAATGPPTPKVEPKNKKAEHRIWIDEFWSFPVDDAGRPTERCAEGALGIVIKIERKQKGNTEFRALKIPRLHAETLPENIFCIDVLEAEAEIVDRDWGDDSGLLAGWSRPGIKRPGLFGKVLPPPPGYNECREGFIAVSYDSNRKPSFGVIHPEERKVYPPNWAGGDAVKNAFSDEFASALSLRDAATWIGMTETPNKKLASGSTFVTARSRARAFSRDRYVFTRLPAIIFKWAPLSLESFLRQIRQAPKLKPASVISDLGIRLAEAVRTLHERGYLHCDIRPANILQNAIAADRRRKEPLKAFYLADYGSFGRGEARPDNAANAGASMIGASVSRRRRAPFYASERRNAHLKEDADLVTWGTIGDEPHGEIVIIFEWATENFSEPTAEQVKARLTEALDSNLPSENVRDHDGEALIQRGDRLVISGRVFEVEQARVVKGRLVVRCNKAYYRLRHEWLPEAMDEPLPCETVPIGDYTVLHQWTESTDIFGLATCILYTVYMAGVQDSTDGERSKATERFSYVVDDLASFSLFRQVFRRLQVLAIATDRCAEAKANDHRIDKEDEMPPPFVEAFHEPRAQPEQPVPPHEKKKLTLRQAATELSAQLITLVPGIRRLLEAFDKDVLRFCLFVHFVICGIQRLTKDRRDYMFKYQGADIPPGYLRGFEPFCASRVSQEGEIEGDQPIVLAHAALMRLAELNDRIALKDFRDATAKEQKAAGIYSDDSQSRLDLNSLRSDVEQWAITLERCIGIVSSMDDKSKKVTFAGPALDKYREQLETMRVTVAKMLGLDAAVHKLPSPAASALDVGAGPGKPPAASDQRQASHLPPTFLL